MESCVLLAMDDCGVKGVLLLTGRALELFFECLECRPLALLLAGSL